MRSSPTRIALACASILALTLALGGCTAQSPDPTSAPSSDSPSPSPLSHLNASLERVPDRVAELLDESGVPGLAVAVVHGDEVVYADGFGVANLDTGALVNADTMFQLASVSKPVGATVIASLVGDGVLEWSTRVRDELPGFTLQDEWVSDQLQLADLYSHRSGLPDHSGDDLASFGLDREQVIERMQFLPLHPFRITYAYNNFGIQVGADVAASAAGQDWASLSHDRIYAPLGMNRTTSRYDEYAQSTNRSVGHSLPTGEWAVTERQINDDIATAAGGVASTANDMAQWLRMLLAGGALEGTEIIDAEALAEAMTAQNLMPQHPADPSVSRGSYGYGFQVGTFGGGGETFVSHSGAFSQGAGTVINIVPALDIGVVVLTNGIPTGLAETLAMEIIDWARNGDLSLDWWGGYSQAMAALTADFDSAVQGDPPTDATPAGDLTQFVGSYSNDYFGEAAVHTRGGELVLTITPAPSKSQTWTLEPWNGDVFRVVLNNVDATPRSVSAVTFDKDAGTMVFEFFEESSGGAGTFTRE